jgi:hypothetical protein
VDVNCQKLFSYAGANDHKREFFNSRTGSENRWQSSGITAPTLSRVKRSHVHCHGQGSFFLRVHQLTWSKTLKGKGGEKEDQKTEKVPVLLNVTMHFINNEGGCK